MGLSLRLVSDSGQMLNVTSQMFPKSLAIDVVLIPPDDVLTICRKINAELRNQDKRGFPFDATHWPHITLLQQYIPTAKLPEIFHVLKSIASNTPPLTLQVTHIHSEVFEGLKISGFEIAQTKDMLRLGLSVTDALEPWIASGDEHSWYRDPGETIRLGSLRWLEQFRNKTFAKHHPHITLGVGPTPTFQNLPIDFTASRLAVCHLGNFNTCRKILKEGSLR